MAKQIIATIIISLASFNAIANWGMIGAGNATCENWNKSDQYLNLKNDVVSWMQGFATAMNLEFSSENKPALKLKLLTREYLTNEINDVCSIEKNNEKSMSSILLEILKDFPREK